MWGTILAGIASYLSNKGDRENAGRADKEVTKEKGKQDRITSMYEAMLQDYYRRKIRYEKKKGLDNYKAFGATQTTKRAAVGALAAFQSPNQIQDPGAIPTPYDLDKGKN